MIVSSIGAENPPDGDDVFSVYLRAKAEADQALMQSDREWTVVRPGALTDEPGAGMVRIDTEAFRNEVSREDVAGTLAVLVHEPRAVNRILYVGSGDVPIESAVAEAIGA